MRDVQRMGKRERESPHSPGRRGRDLHFAAKPPWSAEASGGTTRASALGQGGQSTAKAQAPPVPRSPCELGRIRTITPPPHNPTTPSSPPKKFRKNHPQTVVVSPPVLDCPYEHPHCPHHRLCIGPFLRPGQGRPRPGVSAGFETALPLVQIEMGKPRGMEKKKDTDG